MRHALNALTSDLRYAVRVLVRRPGFAAAAVLSLGLGVGANLAVFRFVDAVILQNLPVPRPDQLAIIVGGRGLNYPWFKEFAAGNDVFASVASYWTLPVNLTARGRTDYERVEIVSGTYFEMLGVRPALGRLLDMADDGAEGAHPVCVISYALWQERFDGDPSALGQTIVLNTHPFQIVGVTERGFAGAQLQRRNDVQVPMSMIEAVGGERRDSWGWRGIYVFGRLKEGVTRATAEPRAAATAAAIDRDHTKPGSSTMPYKLEDGRQGFGPIRLQFGDPILIAMSLSGLVLLLACANLANLLLAKVSERRHEIAVRRALGASRGRLILQLLSESFMLAFCGGTIGIGVALVLDRVLAAMLFGPTSTLHVQITPSFLGLVVAAVTTVLVAIAIGGLPAVSATRTAPLGGLRETPQAGGRSGWASRSLVVVQIAACLVLLFGAGLFARSLAHLRAIDLGLDPTSIVVLTIDPGRSGYSQPRSRELVDELQRLAALVPGVQAAALASITALSGGMFAGWVEIPGSTADPDRFNNNFNAVSPGYLRAVGLPLGSGRWFTDQDSASAPRVVVVNQRFVDYYWPGQSPVGRRIKVLGRDAEVVGVVRTAKYQALREQPQITIYFPIAQRPLGEVTLHARTNGDVARTAASLSEIVRRLAPTVPVYGVATLEDHINAGLSNERILSLLAMLFAALATVVSAAGLYGVVAQSVARRTREVGIRVAVGAQGRDVMRLFASEMLSLVAVGIVLGAPLALAAASRFQSILYGLAASDPSTLASAAGGLAAIALVSVALAARKALRVDPIVALKAE